MRVGFVGGVGRAEPHYARLAEDAGHEFVFHDGDVRGRGAHALNRLVDRCDVVVIVTDVNSHGAVLVARERMRQLRRCPLLLRRCGLARFASLLASFDRA